MESNSFFIIGLVLAGGFALFLFCLGLALVGWVIGRVEMDKRKADAQEQERRHQERLRALELGFPLPEADLARAKADEVRARSAGLVGLVVPLGVAGIAVAATAMILERGSELHPILYAVWGISGVGVMTVIMSMTAMQRSKPVMPATNGRLRMEREQPISSNR
jgi:hypothetical protein